MHLKPSMGYEARDSLQPQSMRAPTHQPTSGWRPPSPAGPLAEIVGSGENITSPDCDAPTGQQKPAQLRRGRPLLHRSTVMYEATDNLRDTLEGSLTAGTGAPPLELSPASKWDPLPGRRGPVSFASLGLLSFLSNRGELQLPWADHLVTLTRLQPSPPVDWTLVGSRPQSCRRVQRTRSGHQIPPAGLRARRTNPRPAQDTAVSRASRRPEHPAGDDGVPQGAEEPITNRSADGGKSSAMS